MQPLFQVHHPWIVVLERTIDGAVSIIKCVVDETGYRAHSLSPARHRDTHTLWGLQPDLNRRAFHSTVHRFFVRIEVHWTPIFAQLRFEALIQTLLPMQGKTCESMRLNRYFEECSPVFTDANHSLQLWSCASVGWVFYWISPWTAEGLGANYKNTRVKVWLIGSNLSDTW